MTSSTGSNVTNDKDNVCSSNPTAFSTPDSRTFQTHDSTFSVSDDYEYTSPNDLNLWNGAALLCADCLGTGLLALPHNVTVVLGTSFGLFFLISQLPINLYAGTILSKAALYVETKQHAIPDNDDGVDNHCESTTPAQLGETKTTTVSTPKHMDDPSASLPNYQAVSININAEHDDENSILDEPAVNTNSPSLHHDTATFDFIGMTSALFWSKKATRWIMVLYYTNIFLVLGNYIVVMSHAVSALVGEKFLCIPTAGLLASTLMFAVSQLRTMARLGRSATAISLIALAIVVAQCLYCANQIPSTSDDNDTVNYSQSNTSLDTGNNNNSAIGSWLRKFSAMGSIGFAVGSQKLLLNIRHEFADRNTAPSSLAVALSAFGTFYIFIILAAGNDPPGFLFDAIPIDTLQRKLAGFFLWIHVVVSYAINSQAICASMDRIFFYQWRPVQEWSDDKRWMLLTGIMAATAFFVANAIPFFKDLVAFIGSLTSVPLTLLLPAVFHRRVQGVPIWWPTSDTLASYSLLVFALIFMITATLGSVYSILSDWQHHSGGFFSCR